MIVIFICDFFDSHFSVVLNNNFVSNNTIGKDVWFDNVNIQHQRGYVVEENHYYPFGLTLASTAAGTTPQPYKFQGKELEKSLSLELNDFGARLYDPQLGRWNVVDPLAHLREWVSPYNFCQNNPINRVDPTGALDAPYVDENGNFLGNDGNDNDRDTRVINKAEWDKVKDSKSSEGTAQLNENSTKLVEYEKGINISSSTWKTLRKNGAKTEVPSIKNTNSSTTYFKPEGDIGKLKDNGAYPLEPNKDFYLPIDGVAVPTINANQVYKIVDGQQAVITNQGVSTSTILTDNGVEVIKSNIADWLKGGWKSSPPASNWNNLYEKSNK